MNSNQGLDVQNQTSSNFKNREVISSVNVYNQILFNKNVQPNTSHNVQSVL